MKTVTCIDLENNTYEVPVDSLRWRPSVYGIIIQDDKILLSPQWDWYDLPGWGIDLWETIEEALIREVNEETGLDVKSNGLVHVDSNFFKHPNNRDDFMQSMLIYYRAEVVGWELSIDRFDDHEKVYAKLAEWIPLSELENIKFSSSIDLIPIIRKSLS